MPNMKFDLRNFDIEGWPESVDKLKHIWNSMEIFNIRQKILVNLNSSYSQNYFCKAAWI